MASTNFVLTSLQERIQSHMDYLTDCAEQFTDAATRLSNSIPISTGLAEGIPAISQTINNNIECVQSFKSSIGYILSSQTFNDIEFTEITLKEQLAGFLTLRLDNLLLRKNNLTKTKAMERPGVCCIYAWTTNPEKQHELKESEKILASITTDIYQTLNAIIVNLCSLVDLRTLPSYTQKLIRMSPSLWPRLQAINDDWGHPDEAIFENQDLDLYEHYLFKAGKLATKPESVIRPESVFCPLFLPATIPAAPPISAATVDAVEKAEEKITVLTKKKKKKKKEAPTTSATIVEPLQSSGDIDSEADGSKIEFSSNTIGQSEEKIVVSEVLHAIYDSKVDSITTKEKDQDPNDLASEEGLKAHSDEMSPDPRRIHEEYQAKKSLGNLEHAFEKTEGNILSILTGSSRTTYESILDPIFRTVSYTDFKTLWTQLGGEIHSPRGGGSHRSLVYRGKTLPIGTYEPHQGIYGKNCIKYPRQAVKYVTSLILGNA